MTLGRHYHRVGETARARGYYEKGLSECAELCSARDLYLKDLTSNDETRKRVVAIQNAGTEVASVKPSFWTTFLGKIFGETSNTNGSRKKAPSVPPPSSESDGPTICETVQQYNSQESAIPNAQDGEMDSETIRANTVLWLEQLPTYFMLSECRTSLGLVCIEQDDLDQALEHFTVALEIRKQMGDACEKSGT